MQMRNTKYRRLCYAASMAVAVVATLAGTAARGRSANGAEWGSLKGKFVYDGKAPTPVEIKCDKDVATCCVVKHFDESLLVDKDGGVANVMVYLRTKDVAVHPDYAGTAKNMVVLDNKECKFVPRVLGVQAGQNLQVGNSDNVGHNTNLTALGKNFIVPSGQKLDLPIDKSMVSLAVPGEVACNIHPWMKGYVLVRPDPYFAVSGADGTFEIKNLPAGAELEFQVWHEKAGYVTTIKLGDKATKLAKGRMKQVVKAGDTDLGVIKVDPANFKK